MVWTHGCVPPLLLGLWLLMHSTGAGAETSTQVAALQAEISELQEMLSDGCICCDPEQMQGVMLAAGRHYWNFKLDLESQLNFIDFHFM